jgi:hypothetical protein
MTDPILSPRLTPEETALLTAYLIHLYEAEKQKELTRFRLSRDSVRLLGLRANLKEAFITDWIEALANGWGWVAFPHGEEFGLVRVSTISGWVRLGTKRVSEARKKLKRGDRSVLIEMRDALAQLQQEEDTTEED